MTDVLTSAAGWSAPSAVDLSLYQGEHTTFCQNPLHMGPCSAEEGGAGQQVSDLQKQAAGGGQRSQAVAQSAPKLKAVPEAPDQTKVAQDRLAQAQNQLLLQHAALQAQSLASDLGVKGHPAVALYGRALGQQYQAIANYNRAVQQAQTQHDNAMLTNQAMIDAYKARLAVAQAADKAQQAKAKLQNAAKGAKGGGNSGAANDAAVRKALTVYADGTDPRAHFELLPARVQAFALTASARGYESRVFDMSRAQLDALTASAGWDLWDTVLEAEHEWCDPGTFCRNPLHPGPCKGWKHTLHAIAPGAYHAMEQKRVEKINERRKARIAELEKAGKKVPAWLKKPVTYDPTKLTPQPGYTPPTAKEAEAVIPATAKEIGEKIALKHEQLDKAKKVQQAKAMATIFSVAEAAGMNLSPAAKQQAAAKLETQAKEAAPGTALSELPAMKKTIDMLAAKLSLAAGMPPDVHEAMTQHIAQDIAQHIDSGQPGLPASVQAAVEGAKKHAEQTQLDMEKKIHVAHADDVLSNYSKVQDWHAATPEGRKQAVEAMQKIIDNPHSTPDQKEYAQKIQSKVLDAVAAEATKAKPASSAEKETHQANAKAYLAKLKLVQDPAKLPDSFKADALAKLQAIAEHEHSTPAMKKNAKALIDKVMLQPVPEGWKPAVSTSASQIEGAHFPGHKSVSVSGPLALGSMLANPDGKAKAAAEEAQKKADAHNAKIHEKYLDFLQGQIIAGKKWEDLTPQQQKNVVNNLAIIRKDSPADSPLAKKALELEHLFVGKVETPEEVKAGKHPREAASAPEPSVPLAEDAPEGKPAAKPAPDAKPGVGTVAHVESAPAPDPKTLKKVGNAATGVNAAPIYQDPSGQKWLFKPLKYPQDSFRLDLDVGASELGQKMGLRAPATHIVTIDGKKGSIQAMYDAKDAFPPHTFDPAKLTPHDAVAMQQQQVLDWLIGNNDSHSGNFLRLPNGELVGIDKSHGFRFYKNDKLDWTYQPWQPVAGNRITYQAMWRDYAEGKDVPLVGTGAGPLADTIKKTMAIPDDQLREMFRGYAEKVVKAGQGQYKNADQLLDDLVKRKNNLAKDFTALYEKANTARAAKLGKPAAEVQKIGAVPKATGPLAHLDMMALADEAKLPTPSGVQLAKAANQPGATAEELKKLAPSTESKIRLAMEAAWKKATADGATKLMLEKGYQKLFGIALPGSQHDLGVPSAKAQVIHPDVAKLQDLAHQTYPTVSQVVKAASKEGVTPEELAKLSPSELINIKGMLVSAKKDAFDQEKPPLTQALQNILDAQDIQDGLPSAKAKADMVAGKPVVKGGPLGHGKGQAVNADMLHALDVVDGTGYTPQEVANAISGMSPEDWKALTPYNQSIIEAGLLGVKLDGAPQAAKLAADKVDPSGALADKIGLKATPSAATGELSAAAKEAHAIANKPGFTMLKVKLPAYEALTEADFAQLDKATQDKIMGDLDSMAVKLKDPKKLTSAALLKAKFAGVNTSAAPDNVPLPPAATGDFKLPASHAQVADILQALQEEASHPHAMDSQAEAETLSHAPSQAAYDLKVQKLANDTSQLMTDKVKIAGLDAYMSHSEESEMKQALAAEHEHLLTTGELPPNTLTQELNGVLSKLADEEYPGMQDYQDAAAAITEAVQQAKKAGPGKFSWTTEAATPLVKTNVDGPSPAGQSFAEKAEKLVTSHAALTKLSTGKAVTPTQQKKLVGTLQSQLASGITPSIAQPDAYLDAWSTKHLAPLETVFYGSDKQTILDAAKAEMAWMIEHGASYPPQHGVLATATTGYKKKYTKKWGLLSAAQHKTPYITSGPAPAPTPTAEKLAAGPKLEKPENLAPSNFDPLNWAPKGSKPLSVAEATPSKGGGTGSPGAYIKPTPIEPDAAKYHAAYKAAAGLFGSMGSKTTEADFQSQIAAGSHQNYIKTIADAFGKKYIAKSSPHVKPADEAAIPGDIEDMIRAGMTEPPAGSTLAKVQAAKLKASTAGYGAYEGYGSKGHASEGHATLQVGKVTPGEKAGFVTYHDGAIVQDSPVGYGGGYYGGGDVKQVVEAGEEAKVAAYNAKLAKAAKGGTAQDHVPLSVSKVKSMSGQKIDGVPTSAIHKALWEYTGEGSNSYSDINPFLRNLAKKHMTTTDSASLGEKIVDHHQAWEKAAAEATQIDYTTAGSYTAKQVAAIDAAMNNSRLQHDTILYRGTNGASVFGPAWDPDQSLVGFEYVEPSYASSSTNYSTAHSFAGKGGQAATVFRVFAPKGTPGVSGLGGKFSGESEVILKHGMRYRVIADNGWQNGRRQVDVEIIGWV